MQSGHLRVALGQLWQDSCVGAVFCQTNPSQAHFWNMGSRKVNLQLKCRSALNLSGSNILQLDTVQSVLISVSEEARVQRFQIKTCILKGRLSLYVDAMPLFKYKNLQKHFSLCLHAS